jgi:hypothetical protein
VASNHQFTFALNIGKDTFSFSTYDQPHKGPACMGRDLKKAVPRQQRRRERRAADPAVKQKKAAHAEQAAAEQAAAEQAAAEQAAAEQAAAEQADAEQAAAEQAAAQPDMGGAAGQARAAAEEPKREPCCRKCKQPVASHPGGTRGCGVSCANTVLTPEKLRQQSTPGKGEPRTLTPVRGEGREEEVGTNTSMEDVSPQHQMKCPFCSETFANKESMNKHMRRKHTKFPCDDCDFIAHVQSDGEDHEESFSPCHNITGPL